MTIETTEDVLPENSPAIFESKDYFEIIKSNISLITKQDIERTLAILLNEYENAKLIGQTKLEKRLQFYIKASLRQIELIKTPFVKYAESPMISEYINKVTPRNSVKITELERYTRIIPKKNIDKIKQAKELNIFDEILILHTDLTNQRDETEAEKAMIARNKDPIAFGIFRDKLLEVSHPRFFVITDWEDEWCNLTFDKLISECIKYDVEEQHGRLKDNMINELIAKCRSITDV